MIEVPHMTDGSFVIARIIVSRATASTRLLSGANAARNSSTLASVGLVFGSGIALP